MNSADYMHTDANLENLKNYFNNFWVVVVINGLGTFISEWLNEFSRFFACLYIFRKVTNYLNRYWVTMVKRVCSLLGHETLKSVVS